MQGDVDSLIANYMLLLYKVTKRPTTEHNLILQHNTKIYESVRERGGREVIGEAESDDEERMVKTHRQRTRAGQGRAGKMFQPKRSGDSVTDKDI